MAEYTGNDLGNIIHGEEEQANVIIGRGGPDILLGGLFEDTIYGYDSVEGPDVGDLIDGQAGEDSLSGNLGNDTIFGGFGNDSIFGDEGNDQLWGQSGEDSIEGGDGNDTAFGGAYSDMLKLGIGDDFGAGGTSADRVYGQEGNDDLFGNQGNDKLRGDTGNDTMQGGTQIDRLFGGDGADVLWSYEDPADPRNIGNPPDDEASDSLYGANGSDTAHGAAGQDYIDGGAGNDFLYGYANSDYIFGGQGDDVIEGGSEDDVLIGGTANDTINGGEGADTLIGHDVSLGASSQVDILTGGDGPDLFIVNGGSEANPAYSFNGNDDYAEIRDFQGVGYVDPQDPSNGDQGQGDQIVLLAEYEGYYFISQEGITEQGITYKEISLNLGFANPDRVPDLIARVYENPNSFFNLETDVIYEPVGFDAQFLAST